jgi:hypothetical protein
VSGFEVEANVGFTFRVLLFCSAEHCRFFEATNHGCANEQNQQIKIEFASISVKVT